MTTVKKLLLIEAELKKIKSSVIHAEDAIIRYRGKPIIFPNTIVTIQGKEGSHKSRFLSEICSAIISKEDCNRLGLELTCRKDIYIVYIDTERNLKSQFPLAIQAILECGCHTIKDNPYNLFYTSLLDAKRKKRLELLKDFISHKRQSVSDNHFVVAIDVISDCIANFNDVQESLELIDYLNELVNNHNCTVIAVIHENPGKFSKARGHLGTELANKSTNVFQVEKNGQLGLDYVEIKFKKSRNTDSYKSIRCKYDPSSRGLMLLDEGEIKLTERSSRGKAPIQEVLSLLNNELETGSTKKSLYRLITSHFQCSERTVDERLKSILTSGLQVLRDGRSYVLSKQKKDGQVIYQWSLLSEEEE